MSDQFVAEIRMFAGNFAPAGWSLCAGQLLPISSNTVLFSLLGTTYGGDGRSTFALPDMEGSAPMMWGQGSGLSLHNLGEIGGESAVTLLTQELPAHDHGSVTLDAVHINANLSSPSDAAPGNSSPHLIYSTAVGSSSTMNPAMVSVAGGSQPHNNMMPYLAVTFIIALTGVYPPRT